MSVTTNSFVISLKRRPDRIDKFSKDYNKLGPNVPLTIVEAVDGLIGMDKLKDLPGSEYISPDFAHSPRVKACAMSHIKVWDLIANSDQNMIGIIFEDDTNFREDSKYRIMWPELEKAIKRVFKNEKTIIYCGLGDVLPIHLSIPSEALFRAQERAHATDYIEDGLLGSIKPKSIFVFEWLTAMNYIIDSNTARFLLNHFRTNKMTEALDVSLKSLDQVKKLATVPLMVYHKCIANHYDSETVGLTRQKLTIGGKESVIKTFYGPPSITQSMLGPYLLKINDITKADFIMLDDYDEDVVTRAGLKDIGSHFRDFEIYGISCFTNNNNSFAFHKHFIIMTREFWNAVSSVRSKLSKHDFRLFLYYVGGLSNTCIYLKELLTITPADDNDYELKDIDVESFKVLVSDHVNAIKNLGSYKACGVYFRQPTVWTQNLERLKG